MVKRTVKTNFSPRLIKQIWFEFILYYRGYTTQVFVCILCIIISYNKRFTKETSTTTM